MWQINKCSTYVGSFISPASHRGYLKIETMKTAKQIFKKYGLDSLNRDDALVFDWPDTEKLKQEIEDLVKERDYYKEQWLDDIEEAFSQACFVPGEDKYDHRFMSSYEHMQKELIKHGRIKQSDCYRRIYK